jgi:hypothetical protein
MLYLLSALCSLLMLSGCVLRSSPSQISPLLTTLSCLLSVGVCLLYVEFLLRDLENCFDLRENKLHPDLFTGSPACPQPAPPPMQSLRQQVHRLLLLSVASPAICCPLSAIRCLLSGVCYLLSAVCCLLSAVCCLLSAVCCLLSAVC